MQRHQQSCNTLGVAYLARYYTVGDFAQWNTHELDIFIVVGAEFVWHETTGKKHMHNFSAEPGACIKVVEPFPPFCSEACLLRHFAASAIERFLARLNAARWYLQHAPLSSFTVLSNKKNVILRIYGNNGHATIVFYNLAYGLLARRQLHSIHAQIDYLPLVYPFTF